MIQCKQNNFKGLTMANPRARKNNYSSTTDEQKSEAVNHMTKSRMGSLNQPGDSIDKNYERAVRQTSIEKDRAERQKKNRKMRAQQILKEKAAKKRAMEQEDANDPTLKQYPELRRDRASE